MANYTINDFFVDYSSSNVQDFCNKLNEFIFTSFDEELRKLNELKAVKLIPALEDATMTNLIPLYYDSRNRITELLSIKRSIRNITDTWIKIGFLADSFYDREKDKMSTLEEIKKLSSADLRTAEVKKRLDYLNVLKSKIKLILTVDLKSIEEDIKDVSNHLKEYREDLSRIQSAVALAMDTGEIPKGSWSHN